MWRYLIATALIFLFASTPVEASAAKSATKRSIEVQILAFNDFHGNIDSPKFTVPALDSHGAEVQVPAGGVAYLAGALETLRKGHRFTTTVSAGDLIGASPLASAYFLDEPTIHAMNALHLDLNAVGNHEFDRGSHELLRMQRGGCLQYARRKPCALEPFRGARFQFLAANVLRQDGHTLFPASAIRKFGPIKIGFIGMTLKETGTLVTPSGVAGLHFLDEAATANALVPELKRNGADAIVLLIHQGGYLTPYYDRACKGLNGAILPILDKLDPAISVVVSGHTHNAYICDIPEKGGGSRLLTSAGKYGTMLTDIRLRFSGRGHRLVGRSARFHIVQGEAFSTANGTSKLTRIAPIDRPDARVAAIVRRYSDAARPVADRVVAHLPGAISAKPDDNKEKPLGDLIADAQLAWARAHGGAQIAFMNGGGVRTDLIPRPDGIVTFGQLFSLQPFGNGLVVQTLTGAQLKRLLEQQFLGPELMEPSVGFAFEYDESRAAGDRILTATFEGKPIDPSASYRVVTNSFMASGGDNYTVLQEGTDRRDVGIDIDALEAFLAAGPAIPAGGRIKKLGESAAIK